MTQSPVRVLIVEDQQADTEVTLQELRRDGLQFSWSRVDTESGFLSELRGKPPDVILANDSLPHFDARSALRLLHREGFQQTPFIVLTEALGEETSVACLKEGAADYVYKDRLRRLGPTVARVLEERRTRAQMQRAEEKLQESEEFYRLLSRYANDAIVLRTVDGCILDANERALAMYGYSLEEMRQLRIQDLLAPEAIAKLDGHLSEIARSNGAVFEAVQRRKDGSLFPVEVSVRNIRVGNKELTVSITRDITKRKQAEETLQELERRFETLVENIPGMVYRCRNDRDWTMEFVSGGSLPLTGYLPQELIRNAVVSYADLIVPGDRQLVRDRVQRGVESRSPFMISYCIQSKTGVINSVEVIGRPVFGPDGELAALEGVVFDVTDKQKLAAQLLQAQKMEAVGLLAGGIAHDFNNQMSIILGYEELLANQLGPNHPAMPDLEEIKRSAERAAALTRQLLAFSRQQLLARAPADLNQIITDLNKMLKRVLGEDILLRTSLAERLPPVFADRGQLEQVLMNLCLNARDAMPEGGALILETRVEELDQDTLADHLWMRPGPYVLVEVTDTGIGMDAATREHAFDPFFTTKPSGRGTGLGLSVVYGIVKQHDGYVTLYSEPEKGSTFRVYLPVMGGERVPEEMRRTFAEAAGGRGETILIAEDEEAFRKLLERVLREQGYKVLVARDGQEALETFQSHHQSIDLVILDMIMPRLSGKKVYEAICATERSPKVLFLSGYTRESLHLDSEEITSHFLSKPFSPVLLARKVRGMLDSPG